MIHQLKPLATKFMQYSAYVHYIHSDVLIVATWLGFSSVEVVVGACCMDKGGKIDDKRKVTYVNNKPNLFERMFYNCESASIFNTVLRRNREYINLHIRRPIEYRSGGLGERPWSRIQKVSGSGAKEFLADHSGRVV
jgi:hypothetical protein